jgi:hypothetical protein
LRILALEENLRLQGSSASPTSLCDNIMPGMKSTSVDSISFLEMRYQYFVFGNLRNEEIALLAINAKQLQSLEHYKVASVRAMCLCSGKWIWLCGSDMGDT